MLPSFEFLSSKASAELHGRILCLNVVKQCEILIFTDWNFGIG